MIVCDLDRIIDIFVQVLDLCFRSDFPHILIEPMIISKTGTFRGKNGKGWYLTERGERLLGLIDELKGI